MAWIDGRDGSLLHAGTRRRHGGHVTGCAAGLNRQIPYHMIGRMDTPSQLPRLQIGRVYDPPSAEQGFRVLVDRLWPRGLRRDAAAVDLWLKDIAPSAALRAWFSHDPGKWPEFVRLYHAELDAHPEPISRLGALLRAHGRLTLLYAARDTAHNHAVALVQYMRRPASAAAPPADGAALARRLEQEHTRLLELLVDVRLALLSGRVDSARASLERMAALHREHAELEEQHLFPALPRSARWPLRTYEAEHRKLVELVQALRAKLQAQPLRLRDARRRLRLLDDALPLQHLMEHHFAREEQGLLRETA